MNPTYPAGSDRAQVRATATSPRSGRRRHAGVWDVDEQGVPHDLGVLATSRPSSGISATTV